MSLLLVRFPYFFLAFSLCFTCCFSYGNVSRFKDLGSILGGQGKFYGGGAGAPEGPRVLELGSRN